MSLLIKYVYCRYESNLPFGPESSSRTGIPLSVKVFIRWVQIQMDISLSAVLFVLVGRKLGARPDLVDDIKKWGELQPHSLRQRRPYTY